MVVYADKGGTLVAIPSQTDMFAIVLKLMADGKEYSRKSAKAKVCEILSLTDDERAERTESGSLVYGSRVAWSISYFERAGMITRVRRGVYVINDRGREALDMHLSSTGLSAHLRHLIATENPWNKGADKSDGLPDGLSVVEPNKASSRVLQNSDQSPREQVERLVNQMDDVLGDELLKAILDHDAYFFEQLVVMLLEKMGYGHGKVTKRSGDGGIDGIISTDELGFHPILTQAKRFDADNVVSSSLVREFAGALGGIRNGIFVTTSRFSDQAIEFARQYPHSTISLIDGKELVRLMIKYDLGVATQSVLRIKRLDLDFFADEG